MDGHQPSLPSFPAWPRRALALLAMALPVVCMIVQFHWHGILYTYNESEIWLAHMQAGHMLSGDPAQTCLLTDDTTYLGQQPRETKVYTHNPWMLPRLACAALFLVGIPNVLYQNLIICLVLYGLYVLCLGRLLPLASWPVLLFLCFLHLDYFGFFRPLFNLGRAWHFPLFFGCLAAMCLRGRAAYAVPFVVFFWLWQFEITFAVFMTGTALVFLLLLKSCVPERCGAWRVVAASALLGSVLSIALFVGQLLLYYGPPGLWADLTQTLQARNNNGAETVPSSFAALVDGYDRRVRTFRLPTDLAHSVRHAAAVIVAHYGGTLAALDLLGLSCAALLLVAPHVPGGDRSRFWSFFRSGFSMEARLLAAVLWAGVAGYLTASTVFRGETYMIYLFHYHPLLVFLSAAAAALGTLLLMRSALALVPTTWPRTVPALGATALVLALLTANVAASLELFYRYRQLDAGLFWALSSEQFRGRSLVIPWHPEAMERAGVVVENLTGRPPRFVEEAMEQGVLPSSAEPEYLVYVHHWFWRNHSCSAFCESLEELGHRTVVRGRHFAILEIARNPAVRGTPPWEEHCEPPEPPATDREDEE